MVFIIVRSNSLSSPPQKKHPFSFLMTGQKHKADPPLPYARLISGCRAPVRSSWSVSARWETGRPKHSTKRQTA